MLPARCQLISKFSSTDSFPGYFTRGAAGYLLRLIGSGSTKTTCGVTKSSIRVFRSWTIGKLLLFRKNLKLFNCLQTLLKLTTLLPKSESIVKNRSRAVFWHRLYPKVIQASIHKRIVQLALFLAATQAHVFQGTKGQFSTGDRLTQETLSPLEPKLRLKKKRKVKIVCKDFSLQKTRTETVDCQLLHLYG